MVLRIVTFVAGLTGAVGASQFPEFSQQYMQRLGGTVDELGRQIDRYHDDAAEVGLSLGTYLDRLASEGPLAQTQAGNIRADMARHSRLEDAMAALNGAGPFMRAKLAAHMGDREIAGRALDAFKPAVPATFEGAMFAGSGFLAGWGGLSLVFGFLLRTFYSLRNLFRRGAA